MAPGPVIDAAATEPEVEQQTPSVDETLKKKPQPEVVNLILIIFKPSFVFVYVFLRLDLFIFMFLLCFIFSYDFFLYSGGRSSNC
jgi:hypothetical protein